MTKETNPPVSLPALLRWSRNTYARAIVRALDEAGYDDIPRNGVYVISAVGRGNIPLSQIIRELAISKQSAGQLVDTLVLRGYLQREIHPDDRRQLTLTLSKSGRRVAEIVAKVVGEIETLLEEKVGANALATTRKTLAALGELSQRYTQTKEEG